MANQQSDPLICLIQIILNLLWSQQSELSIRFGHHSYFNVVSVHFPLKAFPQCEQCRVDGVFQFHIILKSFFKEIFRIDIVLPNSSSFPTKISPARIHLKQPGNAVPINSRNEETHTKGTNSSRLCVFLHDGSCRFDKLSNRFGFAIFTEVCLCGLAGFSDQHPIIRSDPRVNKPATVCDRLHLAHVLPLDQRAGEFFIRRDDYSVDGSNTEGGSAIGDGVQCVFDLEKLSRAGEGG
mmetsp:Transcript_5548/g.11964  ORF Transcript_5548/g.11964 Transcript_5548/m.11964 type:complete len:237 (-) Transcript_5548:270-980(-)